MRFLIAAACAAIAVVSCVDGCASNDYHYSQLVGTRYFRAPIDTYPVSILRVDGKDSVFRQTLVDPGPHEITLQGPPGPASTGKVVTFALDVAPCTRYYLVAVKANRLESDYVPRVDFAEPVPGCTAAKPS